MLQQFNEETQCKAYLKVEIDGRQNKEGYIIEKRWKFIKNKNYEKESIPSSSILHPPQQKYRELLKSQNTLLPKRYEQRKGKI